VCNDISSLSRPLHIRKLDWRADPFGEPELMDGYRLKTPMKTAELCPCDDKIGDVFRNRASIQQRAILIKSEMRFRKGETRKVHSPVFAREAGGMLPHVELRGVLLTNIVEAKDQLILTTFQRLNNHKGCPGTVLAVWLKTLYNRRKDELIYSVLSFGTVVSPRWEAASKST